MTAVKANGITIEYETFGNAGAPPLLLVMGLGMQMVAWEDDFCAALADRGFHVIRFDNRDSGLSTHMTSAPPPDLFAALAGDTSSASYTLADMADDTIGLLDALGIAAAHLVGASMGGMIVQTAAIRHPERVLSLTSIMSTTGDAGVGQPSPEAMARLLEPPPGEDRESVVASVLQTFHLIGSVEELRDVDATRVMAERSFDRNHDPVGFARQLLAIAASGDRTPALAGLRLPATVIHGDRDILVAPSGGVATAAAIPGAELLLVERMGHDMPRALWPQLLDAIERTARRAAQPAAGAAS